MTTRVQYSTPVHRYYLPGRVPTATKKLYSVTVRTSDVSGFVQKIRCTHMRASDDSEKFQNIRCTHVRTPDVWYIKTCVHLILTQKTFQTAEN